MTDSQYGQKSPLLKSPRQYGEPVVVVVVVLKVGVVVLVVGVVVLVVGVVVLDVGVVVVGVVVVAVVAVVVELGVGAGGDVTTAVGSEVATAEPLLFEAMTTTRSVRAALAATGV
jgi:hypothetical protein